MSHPGQELLRRILEGEGSAQETDLAVKHLVACGGCRARAASLLDEPRTRGRGRPEGALRLVVDMIDQERRWGMDSLAALAEWADLRRMPGRRSQRDRVRMSKACHTIAFVELLLDELKEAPAWEEAEFIAWLALLSIERMGQRQQIGQALENDLQAKVWTAVANCRRRSAEWAKAQQALEHADRHRQKGTGDPLVEAGLLSITASTLADQGHVAKALTALDRCRAIYGDLSERPLLARTLVQMANILEPVEPSKGLLAIDEALPLIPAQDLYLLILAGFTRVECLLGIGQPLRALEVFQHCTLLLKDYPKVRPRIRSRFISARLLDSLGLTPQAERLFEEVIERDIEHELYKDALLDLLYLYGRHVKAGEFEKAAQVCTRALTDASLSEITHDQIRDLWTQLLNAAQVHAISQEALKDLRRYLNVHWKQPAAQPPVVKLQQGR